jgi:hypothetical protein
MNMTDLELYRWKIFRDIYLKQSSVQNSRNVSSMSHYWKNIAAFTSVLPRRVGKTNMLCKMVEIIAATGDNVYIIPLNMTCKTYIYKMLRRHFYGTVPNNCKVVFTSDVKSLKGHLFIDEFLYFDNKILNKILDNQWETVTMVSGLK